MVVIATYNRSALRFLKGTIIWLIK
jgi:hypothetical protein